MTVAGRRASPLNSSGSSIGVARHQRRQQPDPSGSESSTPALPALSADAGGTARERQRSSELLA